jgi:hypothetical protein
MNPVTEKIDGRILRLLGLTDVFDLDYDTYMTLLKEAMVSGARRLPPEELALLANERKRVRGKKGRLKPKPQKITASSVATTKFLKPSVQPISTPLLAPAGGVQAPEVQPVNLAPLQGPLESIKKILSSFLDFRKDASEDERRSYEEKRRQKREEGLENIKKGMSAVSDAVKKFVSPFQGIIDRIMRFIFFTLLGRAFTQLIDWFSDPKNKRKVESLKRFIKDWWPSLLGAFVLFFTPFGKFVRGILRIVGGLTGRLVSAIPRIAGAIKGLGRVLLNPWVAVPAAAVGLAVAANEVTGQRKAASVQAENAARAQSGQGLGVQGTDTMTDTAPSVGNMGPTTPYGMLQGAARGGPVMHGYGGIDQNTGQRVSGFGPDTQLIAAMPGEVVINKPTVDALGADTFLSLNRFYGGSGANQPRFGRFAFKSGGVVGTQSSRPISKFNVGRIIGGLIKRQDGGIIPKFNFGGIISNLIKRQDGGIIPKFNFGGIISNLIKRQDGGEISGSITPEEGLRGYEMARKKKELPTWMIEELGKEVFDAKYGPAATGGAGPWRNFIGSGATNMRGSVLPRKQGGGPIQTSPKILRLPNELGGGGGGTDAITEQAEIKKPSGSIKRFLFGKSKNAYDPQRYNSGGIIKESTGMNIRGATADRQMVALQPGEYVLPVDTVNRLGISLIDKLVAHTDSNSRAAKLGKRTINKPKITPLRGRQSGMITLPPIEMSSGGGKSGTIPAGSRVPSFFATSPSGAEVRSMNASIYGIVG